MSQTTQQEQSTTITVRVLISSKEAGSIIGKEGSNVQKVREETSVKAAVSRAIPNVNERILSVTGTPQQVGEAFVLFSQHLSAPYHMSNTQMPSSLVLVRLLLPHQLVGSIIGKAGSKIRDIQEQSQARIVISKDMLQQSTERVVDISGQAEKIGHAIQLVAENALADITRAFGAILYDPIVKLGGGIASVHSNRTSTPQVSTNNASGKRNTGEKSLGERSERNHVKTHEKEEENTEDLVSKSINIPADMVGCIIGYGGQNINHIRIQSHARISISKETNADTNERQFTLSGTNESIQTAIQLLYGKMEEEKTKRENTSNEQ